MKTWTISRRVAFGFTAVIASAIALGVYAFVQIRNIQEDAHTITATNVPGIELVGRVGHLATANRLLVYKHISSTDAADMAALEAQYVAQGKEVSDALDRLGRLLTTDEGRQRFAAVTAARDAYRAKALDLLAESTANRDARATYQRARAELDPLALKYGAAVDALTTLEVEAAAGSAAEIRSAVSTAFWGIIVGLLGAVVIGTVVAVAIIRGTTTVLRNVSSAIDDASTQVAAAANQASSASQSLAEGASQQAASLEETSASLEELSSMTKRNAESAGRAKDVSNRMRQAAEVGASDVQEMNRAMAAIKVSSDEISKIVKTIDEIAFQTNILALNAAVEAARAGEAGMGFAVVADEVRNLAQRSAESAKETAGKIEDSVSRSEHGVRVSQKVAQSLSEIVTSAREADTLVAEIAQASREQEQGIAQLNLAVSEMDKVTQANASTAEETASGAEELNAQATMQKESVNELLALVGVSHTSGTAPVPAAVSRKSSAKARSAKPASHAHVPTAPAHRSTPHGHATVHTPEQSAANGHAPHVDANGAAAKARGKGANEYVTVTTRGAAAGEVLSFRDM